MLAVGVAVGAAVDAVAVARCSLPLSMSRRWEGTSASASARSDAKKRGRQPFTFPEGSEILDSINTLRSPATQEVRRARRVRARRGWRGLHGALLARASDTAVSDTPSAVTAIGHPRIQPPCLRCAQPCASCARDPPPLITCRRRAASHKNTTRSLACLRRASHTAERNVLAHGSGLPQGCIQLPPPASTCLQLLLFFSSRSVARGTAPRGPCKSCPPW